jgi:phage terminase large subunit
MNIVINPLLFNPLFWHLRDALSNPDIRHIYMYGGSSAAKTYSVAQSLLLDGEINNYSSIVFRKEQASINDTIYNDFKEINDRFELGHSMLQFQIKMINEQLIRFRGVDKSGKVKGLKGYKKILLDELDHFKEEDYKELKRRLRGEEGQQILYTWNPVSKEHWVKKKVLDMENWIEVSKEIKDCPSDYSMLSDNSHKWINDRGDSILIKTNHLDNYWVCGHPEDRFGRYDKHVMQEFDLMKRLDPNEYNVYALGEWGQIKIENPFITQFEINKHVNNEAIFKKDDQFIISFDFNIQNTVALFAHVGEKHIHFFDEMEANDLPKLLEKIEFKYGKHLTNCLITGDRSGQNRSHLVSDNMNSYRLIKNTLKLTSHQMKIVTNPKHKENRVTCNTILAFHPDVYFNERCEQTIFDLQNAECDMDGKLIKTDRNIKAHRLEALDCFRYILNTFKKKWIKNYNK